MLFRECDFLPPSHGSCSQPPIVCRNCFSQLEKVKRLQQQLNEVKNCLLSTLKATGQSRGLSEGPSTPIQAHSRKRPCDESPSSPPMPKRQALMDTPVRKNLATVIATDSPSVAVVVKNKKRSRIYHLSRSLKPLGKSLGRNTRSSVCKQLMKVKGMREQVLNIVVKIIRSEINQMCSFEVSSVLRKLSAEVLQRFDWSKLMNEFEQHAPVFIKILGGCVCKKASSKKVSRQPRYNEKAIISICAAIILRYRNQRMNLVQRIVSVLMYCGHAQKSVSHYSGTSE